MCLNSIACSSLPRSRATVAPVLFTAGGHGYLDNFLPDMIGFFGTGLMGAPMARNLLRRNFEVAVWNRTPARYAELLADGATAGATPRAVAEQCDVLMSMLVEPAHLEAILNGPDGILAGLKPGSMFIDTSTGPPSFARRMAQMFAERDVAYVDAPVRGGVGAAAEGKLLIMAGGEPASFERALPVLEALARKVIHVGPPGSGRVAKTAAQLVNLATLQGIAEALALTKSSGADQNRVREVMLEGTSTSRLMATGSERMIARNWEPGLPVWVYTKDAVNLDDALNGTDLDLPVARAVFARIVALTEDGHGELDESALYSLLDP
jgi:2-hydroxy-3-oxopropionate reductase